MGLATKLAAFTLRQALGHLGAPIAARIGVEGGFDIARTIKEHFTDHSQALPKALRASNQKAWAALRDALADGFVRKVKGVFISGDDRGIGKHVRLILEGKGPEFRQKCLRQLDQASKVGLLADKLIANEVGSEAASFKCYSDPLTLKLGAIEVVGQMASSLASEYSELATLVQIPCADGHPLIVVLFVYFFRCEVRGDPKLASELFFDTLQSLNATQSAILGSNREISDGLARIGMIVAEDGHTGRNNQKMLEMLVRSDGERKLAVFMRAALQRTRGQFSKRDQRTIRELCREHGISSEHAQRIVQSHRDRWQKERLADHTNSLRDRTLAPPIPNNHRAKGASAQAAAVSLGDSPDTVRLLASENKATGEWVNSLGMEFRWIPAGRFLMGAPTGDRTAQPSERPQREVTISRPFHAATFPVVNSAVRPFLEGVAAIADSEQLLRIREFTFAALLRDGKAADNLPVVHISAQDADLFCAWLTKIEGRSYRLPTEAEWEYLARAGAQGTVWWDRDDGPADRVIVGTMGPRPADLHRANAWGMIDVLGNVAQWTSSAFAPIDGPAPLRPAGALDRSSRVVRGAGFRTRFEDLRLSRRLATPRATRRDDIGFRLVVDL